MRIWQAVMALAVLCGALSASPAAAQTGRELERQIAAADQALDAITEQDWLTTPSLDLLATAVAASSPRALMRLASDGDARAQALMGSAHENGAVGFALNEPEAVRYYTMAAEQGNPLAQYNLGGMFLDGRGVAQDTAQAIYWRELAAAQGDTMAASVLAWHYLTGTGVTQDFGVARFYLEQCAAADDGPCLMLLGGMYEEGLGARQDLRMAEQLYARAGALGEPGAAEALARLRKPQAGVF